MGGTWEGGVGEEKRRLARSPFSLPGMLGYAWSTCSLFANVRATPGQVLSFLISHGQVPGAKSEGQE